MYLIVLIKMNIVIPVIDTYLIDFVDLPTMAFQLSYINGYLDVTQ